MEFKITYEMIRDKKRCRREIRLDLTDRFMRKLVKETVNKEQLLFGSLLDLLAQLQGFDRTELIDMEEVPRVEG